MRKRSVLAPLAVLSCFICSGPLHAGSGVDDRVVSFSGFGTLGALYNPSNGAAFARDGREPNGADNRGLSWHIDSRIGLQANIKPGENLEAVFQVLSYYRYSNNFQPEVTWAFLKYSPNDTFDFRVGRIGFDVYLLSDTRDVGITYPWVRPPVEFYGSSVMPYVDGGDAVFRIPVGDGLSRIKFYSGLARQKKTFLVNQTEWAGNQTLDVGTTADYSGTRVTAGLVDYQDDHWTARIAHARVRLAKEFPVGSFDAYGYIRSQGQRIGLSDPSLGNSLTALANDFSNSGKSLSYTSLGLAYDNGPLQTQAAISHLSPETLAYADTHSGYFSLAYNIDKFTPYAIVSAIRTRKSDRADALAGRVAGDPLASMGVSIANFLLTTSQQTQHTYAIGMRYNLRHDFALKFQMDMIRNRTCSPVSLAWGSTSPPCAPSVAWPRVPVSWDGRANVYSAVLDFVF